MEQARLKKIILLLAGCSLISSAVLVYMFSLVTRQDMNNDVLRNDSFYQYQDPIVLDAFSLSDHTGAMFDKNRLTGKWSLVFFGYTFCPDICPLTMASIRQFYQLLEMNGEAGDVQVVMISVDPQRDTAEVMGNYVTYFNPEFIGVTGDYADIFALSRQMNAAFSYTPIDADNYLVTHNGEIMLIDPAGNDVGFFKAPYEPELMLENFRLARRFSPF